MKQLDPGFANLRASPWRDGNWDAGHVRSDESCLMGREQPH